ncbi:hypothetical protein FOA52_004686 [Chlamydomonas sp. UWO 241]|nr:hypothetical protein FOA52_004686 [Chlamydomonas sp. UWO 241]
MTYDGIDVCAERLVQQLDDAIARAEKAGRTVTKLSFIGYSLGGLINRYAGAQQRMLAWHTLQALLQAPPTSTPARASPRRATAGLRIGLYYPVNAVTAATAPMATKSR